MAVELIPNGTDNQGHTHYRVRIPSEAVRSLRAFMGALQRAREDPERYEALAEILREFERD